MRQTFITKIFSDLSEHARDHFGHGSLAVALYLTALRVSFVVQERGWI